MVRRTRRPYIVRNHKNQTERDAMTTPTPARKRSRKVTLAIMGMSVSAFALTGCFEEKVDAFQYSSVEQCERMGEFSAAECTTRFARAQAEHERAAPRYQSRADCEAEHGAATCEPQSHAGGGSLWLPLMMGWMMGRSLGGPVATQPLYRSPQAGMARTAAGATVDAKAGPVSVAKTFAARPGPGRVVARGGFGRTGGSTGVRSFGG